MDDGQLPNALILLVMLVFIATSLIGRGLSAGKAARMGFAWLGIFASPSPCSPSAASSGARHPAEERGIRRGAGGGQRRCAAHRQARRRPLLGRRQGQRQPARFLVDSGATTTTISADLAAAAGLEPGMRGDVVSTANGTVFMPRVTAGLVEIGPIRRADKSVNINPADGVNVLGMDFLSSLSSWGVQGNVLVLQP
jgi:aspartyl protease family protein